jgi:hypothetical protein
MYRAQQVEATTATEGDSPHRSRIKQAAQLRQNPDETEDGYSVRVFRHSRTTIN